jgi:hypothetical protein
MFIDVTTSKEKMVEKVQGKDLHDRYMRFIEQHKDYKPLNIAQFGQRIGDRLREGMLGITKGHNKKGAVYVFDIKVFKEWLMKCNYYVEDKSKYVDDVNRDASVFQFDSQ